MISKISIIAPTLLLFCATFVNAQNQTSAFTPPLRMDTHTLNSSLRPIPVPEKPLTDQHVTGATHLEPLKTNMDPVLGVLDQLSERAKSQTPITPATGFNAGLVPVVNDTLATPLSPNELPADAPGPEVRSADFTTVVKDLAYNTMIVLAFGVGFIVVARVWFTKKPQLQSAEKNVNFDVLSSLKIAPKCNLMLIQIGQDRLVVATDTLGVKSVVRLTDSFGSQLDAFDTEPNEQDIDAPVPKLYRNDSPADPTYSLASIGKPKSSREKLPPRRAKSEKEIQKDMEAALKKFGLTDLM
ncbi:hypothetical protein N9X53_06555 [Mariniblastus sp.]|nr:hypothetical protein [Mariniblastus sp.]